MGVSKLFQMVESPLVNRNRHYEAPPGLMTFNSFQELEEEDEIPILSLDDYPEIDVQDVPVPKPEYVRMPRSGQGERKAMKKALKKGKKEKNNQEHDECACLGCGGCGGELQPLIREQPDAGPELHPLDGTERWMMKCAETGCTRIRSVLDSGATDSCAPDAMCAEVRSKASEGSRRGQMYTAAGGKRLANQGEKDIFMMTQDGHAVSTNWQTVDITRPLSSVRQICMQGNRVVFGAQGGVIQHLESGQETHFGIEDNVYVLDLWLPPSQPASGFARPS